MITRHFAVCYNAYCPRSSRTRVTARTREELWVNIYEAQERGELGDVIETGQEEIEDPEDRKARMREIDRILMTSCPMPDDEDLKLQLAAKAVDPSDWDAVMAIDETKARDRRVRERIYQIKMDKVNTYWKHTP
jgi:hypothetical protein